ncbi:hypothetical protein E8E12_005966 [Didymella heteroderae]|uniref:Uncharacterized protein n=1 Tax=Didymella heteroderae TaxID=1769908 RepID=A0A9P5C5C1_9PLEO|nr:hypothetical protein E8E12_005966 [Didymella heteroderae]
MELFQVLIAILLTIQQCLAQTVTPFIIDGPLGSAAATSATQFNTGGSITVAGISITIPENLLVQFPATFVPFKDFAASAGSLAGYEINVEGNYVDGKPIAGRVAISQMLGGVGTGVIGSVNNDGTIQIVGGPLLRVNTPGGVYAAVFDKNPFFTSDEQNPSISSFSGYPITPKNVTAMAPFIPGDYVTWAGVATGGEIQVYTLTAENVQQKTSGDNGDPVYVRVEDVIIAINDGTPNVEIANNRFTGYLSDGTASLSIFRIDVDPCTGAESAVQVGAGSTKAGDVRNKFDIRFSDTTISKAAREYRIKASKGSKPVAKGIQAGQFQAPISEMIWPENNVPGSPITQLAFNLLGQLKDGFVVGTDQFGQLKPWPGSPVPTPAKTCTGTEVIAPPAQAPPAPAPSTGTAPPAGAAPVANAGTALTGQVAGTLITITGSNTNTKLTDAQLTFAWTGPAGITINNANKPAMNFVNPWQTTTAPTKRTFTLKICLASDATICSSASVDVATDKTADTVVITSYQYNPKNGGVVSVTAKSNNVLTGADGANLQISLSGGALQSMTADTVNRGTYTFSAKGINRQPSGIAVKSTHGSNVATTTALIRRRLGGARAKVW